MVSIGIVYTYNKTAYENRCVDACIRIVSAPTYLRALEHAKTVQKTLSGMGNPNEWFSFLQLLQNIKGE